MISYYRSLVTMPYLLSFPI